MQDIILIYINKIKWFNQIIRFIVFVCMLKLVSFVTVHMLMHLDFCIYISLTSLGLKFTQNLFRFMGMT